MYVTGLRVLFLLVRRSSFEVRICRLHTSYSVPALKGLIYPLYDVIPDSEKKTSSLYKNNHTGYIYPDRRQFKKEER